MDQSSTLSDALAKNSFSLSGLLGQLGQALNSSDAGISALSDFSNLITQDNPTLKPTPPALYGNSDHSGGMTSLPSSKSPPLYASISYAATPSTGDQSITGAGAPNQPQGNSLKTKSSPNDVSLKATGSELNLHDLAASLRNILADLKHKNNNSFKQGGANNYPSAASNSSGSSAAPSMPDDPAHQQSETQCPPPDTNAVAATGGNDTSTTPSSTPSQQLSDIIAQLLALVQMMAGHIQQTPSSGVGSSMSALQPSLTNSSAVLASGGSPESGTRVSADALLNTQPQIQTPNPLNALDSANAALTGSTSSPIPAVAGSDLAQDPLVKLLTSLERSMQQLVTQQNNLMTSGTKTLAQITANKGALATVSDMTVSDVTSTAETSSPQADLAAILSNLETMTRNILAAGTPRHNADQTAPVVPNSSASVIPATTTESTMTPMLPTIGVQKNDSSATPTDWWQAQVGTLVGNTMLGKGENISTPLAANTIQSVSSGVLSAAETTISNDTANLPTSTNTQTNTPPTQFDSSVQSAGPANFSTHVAATKLVNLTSTQTAVTDQVILQMNRGLRNGNDQMSLQLHPAELGKITVKLDFTAEGKVQGVVTADNPQTLELLQKDQRGLEKALSDAGLKADPGSLQFNLGNSNGHQAGQSAQGNSQGKGQGPGGAELNGTQTASDENGMVDLSTVAETYYITPSRVNIRV